MNFLEIVQRIKRRCRVTGSVPVTVVGLNEEFARLVDFADESWMYIQLLRPDWKWMRYSMSFPTVAGQATYTLAQIKATGTGFSNFGNWEQDTFRNYLTAVGTNSEFLMGWIPYDVWRDAYQYGAIRQTQTNPTQLTITPALGIGLGCAPLAGYTITGDYNKVATEMVANTDIPGLPSQFHMAIVYKAMMHYGVSEAKPEIYDEGEKEFRIMLARIELQQLPEMLICGPLA